MGGQGQQVCGKSEGARHGSDPGQENSSAHYSHKEGREHPRVPWDTGVLCTATLRLNHTLDANYSHRSKLCATRNRQQRLLWRRCCLVSESIALGACIALRSCRRPESRVCSQFLKTST